MLSYFAIVCQKKAHNSITQSKAVQSRFMLLFSDLMQNPLIVPLKILRGHKVVNDLGMFIFDPAVK